MDDDIAHVFKNGDYKRASELLQKVRDPNNIDLLSFYPDKYNHIDCNTYNATLLHLAAYHGWLDICRQLITEYKYNPHVQNSCRSLTVYSTRSNVLNNLPPPPPLFYATLGGHYEVVTYLINKCNCDPHQQSEHGETPLYLACLAGHYEIVTYLISTCHCVNTQDDYGYNLLHIACRYGKLDITTFLLSLPSSDVNIQSYTGYTPLHMASHYGQLDILKLLASSPSVDVNVQDNSGYTPLHTACHYGQLDIIKFLLSLSPVDVNIEIPSYPVLLHNACHFGTVDVVKFLVSSSSIDVNIKDKEGHIPIHTACRYGQLDIIKFLLSLCSVDVNFQDYSGYTPLHTACHYGHLDITKFLVSLPSVDVNIQDDSSNTLLHTACHHGHLDIIKFLVSLPSVDVNIQDDSGDTPLHTACCYGHLDIIKFLVSLPSVDVHIRDNSGYTPLHTACHHGHLDIIKFLVSLLSVDVNIQDDSGDTPLHTACCYGHLDIIKFLLSLSSDVNITIPSYPVLLHNACHFGTIDVVKFLVSSSTIDVNIKDKEGYTPLHTACRYGQLDIIKFLLSLPSVNVNIRDDRRDTPLHTACHYGQLDIIKFLLSLSPVDVNITIPSYPILLHNACHLGTVDVVMFLVSSSTIDVNIKYREGYTPLHTACRYGHLDIIKFLVSLPSVDVNIQDGSGDTPLHTACRYGHLDIIKFLVSLPSVDVNIQDGSGDTPLHTACRYGHLDIIKFLVSLPSVDVNIQDGSGDTPLHTACHYGHLDIIKFLLTLPFVNVNITIPSYPVLLHNACHFGTIDIVKFLLSSSTIDVNIKDMEGYTPLHTACCYGQLDIVKFLMSTELVNPMSTNTYGDTALHIACSYSNVDIVKYLLSTGHTDPMAENSYQKTPVQMAGNNYDILKLFEPFKQCRVDFPVESYSKVFLCGNTTNGKSSLAHALGQRVKGISLLERLNPFKKQEKAKPLTAGIVPHHLQSNKIGNIVLYDFAGHHEYYSSHEAVLATLMLRSPAVFIILVKLTDKLEDIEMQLYYWASFIQNVCSRMSKKSQVIVVGSHADDKEAKNSKVLVQHLDLSRILKHIGQLEYKGFVAMDCRKQNGTEFDQFITYLSESNKAIVDGFNSISFFCHVLYAFLTTKLKKVAVTLEDLSQMIQNENEPSLPSNESALLAFLDALSDKGLIMFIRTIDSTSSWVIVDKLALLEKINGKLFAPSYFEEYTPNLASNTGLVRVSDLEELFPRYNVDMLVGFLKSLEFCHEIDNETHTIITTNLSSSSEKLLYFPALVSVEPSSEVIITDGFGWCLWCPNPYQFFSTRFLHVLLLQIAYEFSLQINDVGIIHKSPVQTLDRSCHVWKNGICWTRDGVKTVVQVSELNHSIVLLVQPLDESLESESLQIRSLVVQKILHIKEKFCHSCDTRECLISPHSLNMALQYNVKDLSVFKIEDIARVLVLNKLFVTNNMIASETFDISLLLGQLEPYHFLPLPIIRQLFDDSKVSQCIPEQVFREIQERCRPIMDIYPVTTESSTYQSVRDHLNRFSIFGGRNPFVSE